MYTGSYVSGDEKIILGAALGTESRRRPLLAKGKRRTMARVLQPTHSTTHPPYVYVPPIQVLYLFSVPERLHYTPCTKQRPLSGRAERRATGAGDCHMFARLGAVRGAWHLSMPSQPPSGYHAPSGSQGKCRLPVPRFHPPATGAGGGGVQGGFADSSTRH